MGDPEESLSPHVLIRKLENFYGGSGSPITLSWKNPFMNPQSRENGNPPYGERNNNNNKKKPLKKIKRALTNAPAVGLPDVMKPFFLSVHERPGTAVGVLPSC
jgi:hypothetical protein